MRMPVATGLPGVDAPLEWAITADGVLYTAQVPIKSDGSIETGDAGARPSSRWPTSKRRSRPRAAVWATSPRS